MNGPTDDPMDDERAVATVRLLHDVARGRTADPTLLPRVHQTIRRHRRRRVARGTVAVVAAVAAVALATTPLARGVLDRAGGLSPAEAERLTRHGAGFDDPRSLEGGTAGSLGGDARWLAGLEDQAIRRDDGDDRAHVRVYWAGDSGRWRRAVTGSVGSGWWKITLWEGPAGAAPGEMQVAGGSGYEARGDTMPRSMPPEFFGFRDGHGAQRQSGPGLVVVVGTGIRAVESRPGIVDYRADATPIERWNRFTAAGPVWLRHADELEMTTLTLRVLGTDGKHRPVAGGFGGMWTNASNAPDMAGVTPAGAEPKVVACAAAVAPFPVGSTAVLADARRIGGQWNAVAVGRTPGGAYLIGVCRRPDAVADTSSAQELGGFVVPAPAGGPGRLLALLPTKTVTDQVAGEQFDKTVVAVLAPEDAVTVEVAGVTAQVTNRFAFVTLPPGTQVDTLRAAARRADGSVIGTAVRPRTAVAG
jgi:hypothetical protein